jgi:ribosome biogenesis GTPase / thiamine phosphate phosphatase
MKGRIIKSTGSSYLVRSEDGTNLECKITGKYRLEDLRSTNPVVVGDWVNFNLSKGQEIGRITEVLHRNNYIIRKSTKLSKSHQIIAANIDQLVLIVTVSHPVTYLEFIDRYLVSAEAYNIPAIILINKTDLYNDEEMNKLAEWRNTYESIGYTVLSSSLINNNISDSLKTIFKDHVTLLAGISGVGKTSLINTLEPGLDLKTSEISDSHKSGKHTTTFAEMFEMNGGGFIIDTPGIRGFGMTDMEDEPLFHYFREIFRISSGCKFNNCNHVNEPDCAVIQALDTGEISFTRYRSYINLLEEQENSSKYR